MKFRNRFKPPHPGFQIIPMIDIILAILFFYITTQIYAQWENEINVKLPTASSSTVPQRLPGEVVINVLQDGTTVVNRQILDKPGLSALLDRVVKLFPGQPVLIRADRKTEYAHVVRVLDQCKRADLWNISFATLTADDKVR